MNARANNPHRPTLVAIRIEPTFADRSWTTQKLEGKPCFRAFFLRSGGGVLTTYGGAPLAVSGPLLLWLPSPACAEFKLLAGGDGAGFLASEDLVTRIVAESPSARNCVYCSIGRCWPRAPHLGRACPRSVHYSPRSLENRVIPARARQP